MEAGLATAMHPKACLWKLRKLVVFWSSTTEQEDVPSLFLIFTESSSVGLLGHMLQHSNVYRRNTTKLQPRHVTIADECSLVSD